MSIWGTVLRRQRAPLLLEVDCPSSLLGLTIQTWSARREISSASNIEYSKSRKSYEKSLSDLRKQWSKEVEEKARVVAEKEAARTREIEERRDQKKHNGIQAGEEEDAVRMRREEERREKMALKSAKRAEQVQRESVRQGILETMRQERKSKLLEQSRYWIGSEEELINAVDRAVDRIEPLFVSKKVSK